MRPFRVLHVLAGLGQGGIEKWLVNLTAELQRQRRSDVQFEFITLISPGGCYQNTLETLGCRVQHCQLDWKKLPIFLYRLARQIRQGSYDVVHCHADYLSGLILPVAHAVGVRTRIGHVHATQFAFQARKPFLRHLVGRLLRRLHAWDGGVCIGTSSAAIDTYLGKFRSRMRNQVCVCGIPCANYRAVVNAEKRQVRQSLEWPEKSKVILHVGRHSESKNLFFLLEIFAEILRRDDNCLCVLVGSGPLSAELQNRASELGISKKALFLGNRDDVPQLMRGADLFLLPSLFEGLGLVIIEAQAVGLRSLVSDIIPPEVEVAKNMVYRLPLQESPDSWAERALQILREPLPDPESCLKMVEASPFNIKNSARTLLAVYKAA